ncbi:hypothetical protein SAMN05216567_106283 [Variovorax sp. OK605]|uniref:hypothetical protein n=1 Tax=Variovorax sp. OK605 TaxID=1855317 RepID=UPI0008ED8251|nr:hypothetical protein [Variovorax sp. OK605]SFP46706.1 hypothetical protein SAMN05216567_106283 [Variovorax sp. OK605]
MKRGPFDPGIADVADVRAGPLPASEELVQLAHARWLSSLRKNGNQPSPEHQHAGWQLLRAMVDQLYGVSPGRYAYAVPCGGGKTQAVVALLLAMFELQVLGGKTVLVVAQQVSALCSIKRQLLDSAIPEHVVGIIHSLSDAEYPNTGSDKRPIMLATHARLQRDGSLPECCRNRRGELHDLVVWDEALISTEAICLDLAETRTSLGHFAERCSAVAKVHARLRDATEQEHARQQAGQDAREIAPLITEEETAPLEVELKSTGYLAETGRKLREQALAGIRLLRYPISIVDARNGNSAGLMRYVVRVPDELSNIAILDASHAIDELRQADPTIRSGTTEAMTNFKDFGAVKVKHYPIPSGRDAMRTEGRAILEAVRIAKELPHDEPVLFVTYKDDLERKLRRELQAAGVSAEAASRRVITWGRHTSDNSYTHCKHVVLVGLLRLPLLATASQLAAQTRDLTHRRNKLGLLGLERSVIAGEAMQAINRGCMRLTDAEGKAHPMTAHIIALDDLQPLLEKAMPGLQWQTAAVKEPTRAEAAADQIVQHVLSLPESPKPVSKQSIFASIGLDLRKDAKAEAMQQALVLLTMRELTRGTGFRWEEVGRSLVRRAIS